MAVMISELYDALRKAGVDEAEASNAARAVYELRADLPTKTDLRAEMALLRSDLKEEMALLRTDLKAEMAEFKGGTHTEIAELKAEIRIETTALRKDLQILGSDLRKEMAEMTSSLIKWNVGTLIAMTGVFAAIVKYHG